MSSAENLPRMLSDNNTLTLVSHNNVISQTKQEKGQKWRGKTETEQDEEKSLSFCSFLTTCIPL